MAQTSIITFNGKLDNLVGFRNTKGTYSLRRYNEHINDANSDKQKVVRTKFLLLNKLGGGFETALIGLQKFAKQEKISLRNAFTKVNYPHATIVDPTTIDGAVVESKIEYASLHLSKGNAIGVLPLAPSFAEPEKITISYEPNDIEGVTHNDDIVIGVAYIPSLNITLQSTAKRSENSLTITTPTALSGEGAYLYVYTQNINDSMARARYWAYTDPLHSGTNGSAVAWAELKSLASESEFSETTYVGNGTIS